jgi:GxxExxY protein
MKEKLPPRHEGSKNYLSLTEVEEDIGRKVVNAAYTVHKELGPGLLEKIYEICFCHELEKAGLNVKRQVEMSIVYDNIKFEEGLRIDVLVEDLVICELKAVDLVNPVWEAQLLSYLKLGKKRLGYLINFNVPLIKNGIKRMII